MQQAINNFQDIEITCGDFLAGGGGVTEAMSQIPGAKVQWVLNHDPVAIRTNLHHHNHVQHYWADMYKQDEHEMKPVDFCFAGIECTQHSKAKGGADKNIGSYMLGYELVRYLKHIKPSVMGIENVPEFKKWGPVRLAEEKKKSTKKYSALKMNPKKEGHYVFVPIKERMGEHFEEWKQTICDMGYNYDERIYNAADLGIPTRRVRYFAFFTAKHLDMQIPWPVQTHNKFGTDGLQKWIPCKNFIDLTNEGNSIFGREFNPNVAKGKRRPLVHNTLKRIAGGIKKYADDMHFIFQYYGTGDNVQPLEKPLHTITTKDRHVLVTLEKMQFIQDHCHTDNYHTPNDPLNPILTREMKQLVTLEKKQFISQQYNSNGNPGANNQSINEPLNAMTTKEKFQFITAYFSSNGNQGSQNHATGDPLGTITTGMNKQALVTAVKEGKIDFDVKMRFLTAEELSQISTFPDKYFTDPRLRLTKKEQVKLIGNAVPVQWAKQIIQPVMQELQKQQAVKTKAA